MALRPDQRPRLPEAVDDDVEWVVLCSEGYTSSLAAAALRDLGLHRATDVVGGYLRAGATPGCCPSWGARSSDACTSPRSRSVFSGVHPGGCSTAAQAFATSLT